MDFVEDWICVMIVYGFKGLEVLIVILFDIGKCNWFIVLVIFEVDGVLFWVGVKDDMLEFILLCSMVLVDC